MRQKAPSFAELLKAAAKLVPGLLDHDGKPRLSEIARYCEKRGHPVSQPTLHRHVFPKPGKERALKDEIAKELEAVFRVPARYWKGESMNENEARALSQFNYETILLAQKIEALPPKIRDALLIQIENATADQEEMRRILATHNVTPIDRAKR